MRALRHSFSLNNFRVDGIPIPFKRTLDYFGELPKSRTQYRNQAILAGMVKPYGAWYNARDSVQKMDDYMSNRGLNWSDIKYPSSTMGYSGYSGYGSILSDGMNFVSSNVAKLYR